MKKLKSLIAPMFILAVIAAVVLVIAFWREEPEPEEIVKVNAYEGKEEELVLENERLRFVMEYRHLQHFVILPPPALLWKIRRAAGYGAPIRKGRRKTLWR